MLSGRRRLRGWEISGSLWGKGWTAAAMSGRARSEMTSRRLFAM